MDIKKQDKVINPCKRCGYDRPRLITYGHIDANRYTYRITCPNCSYCTKEKDTAEQAINAWNRPLHSPPKKQRQLDII